MAAWINRILALVLVVLYVWSFFAALSDGSVANPLGPLFQWHRIPGIRGGWALRILGVILGGLMVCFGETFHDYFGSHFKEVGPNTPGCAVRFIGWGLLLLPLMLNLVRLAVGPAT